MKIFAITFAITGLVMGLVSPFIAAAEAVNIAPGSFTKEGAQEALKTAQELLAGTTVKDTAGCLYVVGVALNKLVLVPVVVNGSRVCVTKR